MVAHVFHGVLTGSYRYTTLTDATVGSPLDLTHASQLVRYFNVTDTEFAILTNGEVYEFYAQLDAANRMDEKPFMTINLGDIDARVFPHLEMCTKSKFDFDTIAASAEELKYVAELKKILSSQFRDPDTEWVKFLAARVTARRMTAANLEIFTKLVTTASSQFLKDEANRRLRSAQDLDEARASSGKTKPAPEKVENDITDDGVVTTEEELHAYGIIRAICCSEVPSADITLRDAKSYCAILYQDNNRQPIARLYFDRKVPRVGIFDPEKQESQYDLGAIEDIYQFTSELRERVRSMKS